jgi:broad specificity phosphatase PhoE
MKLYIARHGRTNYNDLGLCNADPSVDVHLTELGLAQAQQLAEKLRQTHLDTIYISELPRTRQTAEVVNTFHRLPITVDPLLNDGLSGFEGKPATELMAVLDAADNRWTTKLNGGESIEEIKKRAGVFLLHRNGLFLHLSPRCKT